MEVLQEQIESYLGVGRYAVLQTETQIKDAARMPTSILGWKRGRSVLIEQPDLDEARDIALRIGQPCVVRFLHDGNACAFPSVVMAKIGMRTGGQISLCWPERLESHPLRKHERVRFEAPCAITRANGTVAEGRMKDISLGGCGLVTASELEKGEIIELKFALLDGVDVAGLQMVVRVSSPRPGGRFVGCELLPEQDLIRNRVSLFVSMELARCRTGQCDSHTGYRVMIVDPVQERFDVLSAKLGMYNIETFSVRSAVDAIYALRAAPFHTVVVSQDLPDLAGVELCRVLSTTEGMERLSIFLYGGTRTLAEAVLKVRLSRWCPETESFLEDVATEILHSLDVQTTVCDSHVEEPSRQVG